MKKLEAQQTITESDLRAIEDHIAALRAEAEQLRGIFAGAKRKELEQKIDFNEREMRRLKKLSSETQAKLEAAKSYLSNMPDQSKIIYQIAVDYQHVGKYRNAYQYFMKIPNYKDVDTLLKTDPGLMSASRKQVSVGGCITFGHYPQQRTGSDRMPIEWLVLDRSEGRALLISRCCLDVQPYNTTHQSVTWETCSLRNWLNGTFLNKAFSEQEQEAILLTDVENSSIQAGGVFRSSCGNNTRDKIFLLSTLSAMKYLNANTNFFPSKKAEALPTDYVRGALKPKSGEAGKLEASIWWLRSPGGTQNNAAIIHRDGTIRDRQVEDASVCVRPAIWVDLDFDAI